MEYKRKVTTRQEGVSGEDTQFGSLKMLAKGKRMMPIVFVLVMLVFIIAIFSIQDFRPSEHKLLSVLAVIFGLIALMQLATIWDEIAFYEYGLEDRTLFHLRKRRMAYDEIKAIVEVKKTVFGKDRSQRRVSMWKIYPKQGKALVIDATAYIGISNIIISVRHDTKIKNIAE
ncbi:MAG: hypothetical protein HFE68_04700 [Erysipelotrichaceae bacterium]|nr:hypothetical protein [Erysipelotrichaceae bacterium]MCI9312647.1 hypothetical protein [Erysipelotrichaceae bacterium]